MEPAGRTAVTVLPNDGFLTARLPVADLAVDAVVTLVSAVNRLLVAAGLPPRSWCIDPERVAAAFGSDTLIRIDGAAPDAFAPLSGFFATDDGWVRTHANYPHHRDRLLAALGLPAGAEVSAVAAMIGRLDAADVEHRATRAGALAVRVQTEPEWRAGAAAAPGPLIETADATPGDRTPISGANGELPLAGIRVLDLTRVLAGPVAGSDLALLGAQVLRIDSPTLPEIAWQHLATGAGKRSALLDLRSPDEHRTFDALLADADVLLTGYRPGTLDEWGIDSTRPGLVHGSIRAWDPAGPRAGRRGFDSLVQAATGIALIEGDGRPGALPVQALDHASGHLLAAGVIDALARRLSSGSGARVDVVLERTAAHLLDAPGRSETDIPPRRPGERTLVTRGGTTTVRPVLAEYDDAPFPARPLGSDRPAWIDA